MSERIVVSCRMNGEEVGRPESRYLDRARALTQHAEALGATLAGWSATTLAFAWDADSLDEAIEFACKVNGRGEKTWACAVARGALEPLADKAGGRADLAWGEPLVAAVILARAARPGEVVVEGSFAGIDAFVATGQRLARDGERRVRGIRIDPRQPWKKDAAAAVERMVTPPFVGPRDLRALLARPGLVHLVRADPGLGGTRMLSEIARTVAPAPSILVAPAAASVEPLGALRRAMVRALSSLPYPDDPDLAPVLDMFLGGIGASIEQAAGIVGAFLRPKTPAAPPGALLIDDAGEIDAESLEACAQVVAWMPSPFHVFLRIDATDQVPGPFAALPLGMEVELGPLDREDGRQLARGVTAGALGPRSARRVARRAGYAPLAIVEELAFALTTGEVTWAEDRASLRTAASLSGKPSGAARWISKRAKATAPDERGVLATIALFGGEAPLDSVRDALALIEPTIAVEDEVRKLMRRHWLVQSLPGWVALPSRTHKDTIADLLDEARRRVLHRAIADVLEQSEGELGCAEAANHAVKGGDGERAARLALRAARAAQVAGMSKSATRLLTLARLADPKCEPLTRQQLLTSLPPPIPPPSAPPSSRARAPIPAAPMPAVPPAPPSRTFTEDAETRRLTPLNTIQAARVIDRGRPDDRDSDFPTVINAPAFAVERPAPPIQEPLDRPTEPDPIPAYVLHPPPRPPPPPPRMSVRGMPAVVVPRAPEGSAPQGLPKPAPPLPLRASVQAMPAVAVPRAPVASRAPAPGSRAGFDVTPPPPVARPSPAALPVAPPPPPSPAASLAAAPPRPTAPKDADAGRPAPPPPAVIPNASPAGDSASEVVSRMSDLARAALLEGDAQGIDRWTEGLRAAGARDRLADRIEAIGRLTRGQIGEALRSLRARRDEMVGAAPSLRAQGTLALGLGLAAANRPDEALLEGLDALARAKEGGDPRAVGACLAFLARLYGKAERGDGAALLGAAARAVLPPAPPSLEDPGAP